MISNSKFKRIAFYIVAHQDDWQLFMDPLISFDLTDETCKTVIIHTTAGDAGKEFDYWKAREDASVDSVHFRLSASPITYKASSSVIIKKRLIRKDSIENCRLYFLRLPDGKKDGSGFFSLGHVSLEKLFNSLIDSITSIDGVSVYQSWEDLVSSIETIILDEIAIEEISFENVSINAPDYDVNRNPNDHSDHYATGLLLKSMKTIRGMVIKWFAGYDIVNDPAFINGDELFWKVGLFSIYHHSILQKVGYSTLGERSKYEKWCFRNCRFHLTSIL